MGGIKAWACVVVCGAMLLGSGVARGAEKEAPSFEAFAKEIGAPGSRVDDYGWEES